MDINKIASCEFLRFNWVYPQKSIGIMEHRGSHALGSQRQKNDNQDGFPKPQRVRNLKSISGADVVSKDSLRLMFLREFREKEIGFSNCKLQHALEIGVSVL